MKKAAGRKAVPKATSVAVAKAGPETRRVAKPKSHANRPPALNRPRRVVDADIVTGPPSSLDLNRTASAARSGHLEIEEHRRQLTQTGPALTGGDVDADWESAYSVGDEAPGGDNPTPDQDIVDEIGEALGLQYQDSEELKGEGKVVERDLHRWELDPASSDDYEDR